MAMRQLCTLLLQYLQPFFHALECLLVKELANLHSPQLVLFRKLLSKPFNFGH